MRRNVLILLLAAPLIAAGPPKKQLTLERITGDPPLVPRGATQTSWRDAGHYTFLLQEGKDAKAALYQVDAATGKKDVLLTAPALPDGKTVSLTGAQWSRDGQSLLLSDHNDLFWYDAQGKALKRLTEDREEEELPAISPDGSRVAFVRANDLWTVETATGKLARLTTSGADHVLNGKLDWVYEEELANRRSGRAYEWSPDSSALVYLRLDESHVPEYPIVDFLPTNGKLQPQRYPKSGDPNAVPSVHIVDVTGTETGSLAVAPDGYVAPEMSWTADGKSACVLLLNRAQTEVNAVLIPRGGASLTTLRVLLTEKDPAWINSILPPHFLKDGSGFLWRSERSGFLHLYRYGMDGALKNAVTSGDWMIDDEPQVDEAGGFVYLVGTEKDPRQRHLYRVKLDGSGFTRLSQGRGQHELELAPGGAHYVDRFSDIDTPPRLQLCSADGKPVAMVDEPRSELADYAMPVTELSSFKGKDGTLFYTRLVKPPDFNPARKYPVVVYVYGGPHAQVVRDRWGATSMLDYLLASRGYLVWSIDNRGSWGRGHAFETPLLKRMGKQELEDQLEGIAEVKKLKYVDPSRIGISGWSYGGYLTLYAATHAGATFKCAVAGAPVVDWKFYDSIYTERYMKRPKDNPEGYKSSSPLEAAGSLGTKLLILHGTSDDNVHMQNTIAFTDALMRAQKDFTFVPLPRQKHGPRDPAARQYVNRRILDFFDRNL